MSRLFNSVFEVSLRIVCILSVSRRVLSLEKIQLIDFVSTYGKDFGVAETNLHGNNEYKKSEQNARFFLIKSAIKKLVLEGLVQFTATKKGFRYFLSQNGKHLFNSLTDEYAEEFSKITKGLIDKSEEELKRIISN